MEDDVDGMSVVTGSLLEDGPTDCKLERIKKLEDDLETERKLKNELQECNEQLTIKIAELQKQITNFEKDRKDVTDVGTQTDEDVASLMNSTPDNAVPEKVETSSIADSIRNAAEAAMTNSGFVYDENSGQYYDYSSGYYYNPENRLYYDTNTGIYYYFNETTNTYEFHSQVEVPHQAQTQYEIDGKRYHRRKNDRGNRRKDLKERNSNSAEHEDTKNEKWIQKEKRHRSHERTWSDRQCQREKRRERKPIYELSERRMEKKRLKRKKYENIHSKTNEKERRSKGKKRKKDKKERKREKNRNGCKNIIEDKSKTITMKKDDLNTDQTCQKESCKVTDEKHEKNEMDVIVISSDEVEIEEGEIEDDAGDVNENNDDFEDGEIPTSPSCHSSSGKSSLSDISSDSMSDDISDEELDEENKEVDEKMEEEIQQVNPREYPPCIRMIVTKSESIQPGSLYIITCMGGSIGREGSEHAVVIPEIGISKRHAEIFYCQESWQYYIKDLGSQNGTQINSKNLAEPRTESEAHVLSHKDYLTIGGTMLRLHIHPGAETCDDCEPGQVQALLAQNQPKVTVTIAPDKEQQRRKGLKVIKKKYGLTRDNYVEKNPSTANPLYNDRADTRRKTVGSDNPHMKDDLPSSVDREISSDNLGRKMMEKMGWKSGETLGKDNTGIKEPINVLSNNKRAGLGGQAQRTITELSKGNLSSEKWDKARERYDALTKPKTETNPVMVKLGQRSTQVKKIEMKWTSGGVIKPTYKKENIFGSDDEEEEGEENSIN